MLSASARTQLGSGNVKKLAECPLERRGRAAPSAPCQVVFDVNAALKGPLLHVGYGVFGTSQPPRESFCVLARGSRERQYFILKLAASTTLPH
jgi:hypothetical protein